MTIATETSDFIGTCAIIARVVVTFIEIIFAGFALPAGIARTGKIVDEVLACAVCAWV